MAREEVLKDGTIPIDKSEGGVFASSNLAFDAERGEMPG